jgi:hypothetical protein
MSAGKWTPPNASRWPTGNSSAGCASATNAPAPSCGRPFSPEGNWTAVGAEATRRELRAAFARWGLPGRLRVDNGAPWGATGGLPTALALWVLGLGVGMHWNDPRRPQQNGVVERGQGVGKAWAEPHTCRSAAELQGRLDHLDVIQRERYPSIDGRSRMAAYPSLAHTGRPYTEAGEATVFAVRRAGEHVAERVVERLVGADGRISLYDRPRYVGRKAAGLTAYVTLDPEAVEWVVSDAAGACLRRLRADELGRERILALDVSRERGDG